MFANLFAARRPASARTARRTLSPRRLRCEPLEERQLLSAITTFSNNTPMAIKDRGTITSALTVPAGYVISGVTLNITHTRNSDLQATVIGPDGTRVPLFAGWQVTGQNFTNTSFDDRTAGAGISLASAPYSGTYNPVGYLDALRGKTMQGTWKLEVIDSVKGATGTLNSWLLTAVQASAVSTDFLDTNPTILGHADCSTNNTVAMSENGDAMALWIESKGRRHETPLMTMAARYDAATATWGTPAILSNTASTGVIPTDSAIAGDGQGNYLAEWYEVDASQMISVWVNRYVAGSGWQGPQTLDADTHVISFPALAMAYDPAAGVSKAVVTWSSRTAAGAPADVKVNLLTNFAGNTWSGASLAENRAVEISPSSIDVGMAADGDFLITFSENVAPHDLYYRYYQWSTGWSGPESTVESRPEDAVALARLAMNDNGAAIVSWRQYTGTGGVGQTWARRWNGSDWAAEPELVSDDPNNGAGILAVAISDNGEAAVMYLQKRGGTLNRDTFVRRYDGAAWGDIVKVNSEDQGVGGGEGRLAMDDSGNILAVWNQSGAEFVDIWSAKFDHSASTWAPAAKVENAAFNAYKIAVAVNSSGVATTVWLQPDATQFHIYANRTTLAPAGAQPLAAAAASPAPDTSLYELLAAEQLSRSSANASAAKDKHDTTLADLALLELAAGV